jgi:hypothetical protein
VAVFTVPGRLCGIWAGLRSAQYYAVICHVDIFVTSRQPSAVQKTAAAKPPIIGQCQVHRALPAVEAVCGSRRCGIEQMHAHGFWISIVQAGQLPSDAAELLGGVRRVENGQIESLEAGSHPAGQPVAPSGRRSDEELDRRRVNVQYVSVQPPLCVDVIEVRMQRFFFRSTRDLYPEAYSRV